MNTREKILYPFRVRVNWRGEVHEVYTHAATEQQARRNALHKVAKELKLTVGFVIAATKATAVDVVRLGETK